MIPCLKYRNAGAAIEWLCEAFGFERNLVVKGVGKTIAHAQLSYGRGMVMLGSLSEEEVEERNNRSGERGTPGAIYVVVEDCDAHFRRAREAGANVVTEPNDKDYGGRDYECRDPEGHAWCFGTYDPFG